MTNTSQNTSRNKLTRQQLELINRRTIRYPLPIAEKDYFLALAIRLVYKSSLKNELVFKGGTALHQISPNLRGYEDNFRRMETKQQFFDFIDDVLIEHQC